MVNENMQMNSYYLVVNLSPFTGTLTFKIPRLCTSECLSTKLLIAVICKKSTGTEGERGNSGNEQGKKKYLILPAAHSL